MVQLRVRARAVDMLGRQQIAGIPTAIHELFKNSHDAYAERVEIDYFRRTKTLVLRDDGYGMTREDVENRWLTLGTESRLGANRPDTVKGWTGPKELPRRTLMGEKGIGRLAIAAIAPITLLLSRAVRPEGLQNLVVTLVHWGLFEQPMLDISSIDVPVAEFPGGTLPTRSDIHKLIGQVQHNIENLRDDLDDDEYERLLADLEIAKRIAPDKLDANLMQFTKKDEASLSLTDDGYGTHFILFPTAPELNDDIDSRGGEKDASSLERYLLGFSNTMTGDVPDIRAEFRDHNLDEEPNELIGPGNFFLPEEYENADHHFFGEVDEHGQFTGTVRIYGKSLPFVCNWVEGKGRLTKCGSFSVNFAYVQGRDYESHLQKAAFDDISLKLDRIGGLYIYRNGIRVLPYGNSSIDFLDIEKRRTKSAQDWFFSYRRLFGYVAISHEHNGSLSEKAGREGFRQNQAYRDFRTVLMNLFQRLALEFFRPTSPQGETFWEKKDAFEAESKLLKKQKKKADERRTDFEKLLENFFEHYETGDIEKRAELIEQNAVGTIDRLLTMEDDGDLALGIRDLEKDLREKIQKLRNDITIIKPRGLGLTKKLENDWAAYQRMSEEIRSDVINPLRSGLDERIRAATEDRISETQRREAAIELLESQRDHLVRDLSSLRKDAYAASEDMQKTLKEVVREEFSQFREVVENLLVNFTRKTAQNPEELENARDLFEREVSAIREREASLLEAIRRQMEDLAEGLKERETTEDQSGALEQKNQRLEEQLDFYSEFAQMGMGVGILQHEFENTARNMRLAMRDMKPWADGTPALKKVYRRLRNSFDHLDGYLKMLDPLGRRLQRRKIEISGDEIRLHLRRIFGNILKENGIEIIPSDAFLARKVKCRSSALLGAFVNVVDNAIYWVANGAKGEKTITLDVDDTGFLISNTGPGIEERMRDRIFDFGETYKPGGRGMGLAISKDTLHREDFDLELIQAGSDAEPVFRIRTIGNEKVEGGCCG